MAVNFSAVRSAVRRVGPTRVVVARDGCATTPALALQDYGIVPEVVYVRGDGWTLGAPRQFARVAWRLWAESWVEVIDLTDDSAGGTDGANRDDAA
jgi:hypothetical protein